MGSFLLQITLNFDNFPKTKTKQMQNILVTGATGNVGRAVIDHLLRNPIGGDVIAAVRDVEKEKHTFNHLKGLSYGYFDFEDSTSFNGAFKEINVLFLLRPPHISDIEPIFKPLLLAAKQSGLTKIVFLSVQGAEKSKVIPHNKLERLITSLGFHAIFVRPSYFMQNLTTTLLPEIKKESSITLPAGRAKFNWVDVEDIGAACAVLLRSFDVHNNGVYEITGNENFNFNEVAKMMTQHLGAEITYHRINPLCFYIKKRRAGMPQGFALVMTLLHFLPRLQKEPRISSDFVELTGKSPISLNAFLHREKETFQN